MEITLPLDEMTYEEKWGVIEAIYADLIRRGEELPPLDWHEEVLEERLTRLRTGEGKIFDLDEVERRLDDLVK